MSAIREAIAAMREIRMVDWLSMSKVYPTPDACAEAAAAELADLRRNVQELHMEERGGCGKPDHVGAVPSDEGTHYCETCRALAAEQQVAEQAAEIQRLTAILDSGEFAIEGKVINDAGTAFVPLGYWLIALPKGLTHWKGGEA